MTPSKRGLFTQTREAHLAARSTSATALLWLALSATANDRVDLASFVRDAVASNSAVLAAESSLRAHVERRAGAARSYDNPELSIQTEEIGAFGGSHHNERRVVVGVAKQFDLHGKRQARVTVAEAQQLVAQAELETLRGATAGELLNALARWRTATARARLLEAQQEAMADFESLAKRQRDAGDISHMEADLATLALAETRMRRAAAEAQRTMAAEAVRRVTFHDDMTGWPTLDIEFPPLAEMPMEAISELPAVRAAMLRARAASAVAAEETRNRRPNPTFSLGVGREAGVGLAELGISVPLPLLDRGTHAVSAANADATAAARESDDVARRALVRFQSSAERYRIARRAWRRWLSDGAGSLEDREVLARRSWEAGELDPRDYLGHVESVAELRMQALDLRHTVWEAWFEWLLASGRWEDWLGMRGKNGGGEHEGE